MSKSEKQLSLFDNETYHEKEWKGMPEFNQKDLTPYRTIIVHFKTREDMSAFAKLINQRITPRTQSLWYPEVTIETYADKRYVDIGGHNKVES